MGIALSPRPRSIALISRLRALACVFFAFPAAPMPAQTPAAEAAYVTQSAFFFDGSEVTFIALPQFHIGADDAGFVDINFEGTFASSNGANLQLYVNDVEYDSQNYSFPATQGSFGGLITRRLFLNPGDYSISIRGSASDGTVGAGSLQIASYASIDGTPTARGVEVRGGVVSFNGTPQGLVTQNVDVGAGDSGLVSVNFQGMFSSSNAVHLQIYVDGVPRGMLFEQQLTGNTEAVGSLTRLLDLTPGAHTISVEVSGGAGFVLEPTLQTTVFATIGGSPAAEAMVVNESALVLGSLQQDLVSVVFPVDETDTGLFDVYFQANISDTDLVTLQLYSDGIPIGPAREFAPNAEEDSLVGTLLFQAFLPSGEHQLTLKASGTGVVTDSTFQIVSYQNVIPEPQIWTLALAGLGSFLARRRR